MASLPLWAAIRTVKQRIGTWRGYEQISELMPDITREDWATTVAQARAALANKVDEFTRPLNRRPIGQEIQVFNTSKQRGFLQSVEVFVMDRDTGMVETRYWGYRTDTLRSRQTVIENAMADFQAAIERDPDRYREDVLDAYYSGTYKMQPKV